MNPEDLCDRRRCGDELRWHNPCSLCECHAFLPPMTAAERAAAGLDETGEALATIGGADEAAEEHDTSPIDPESAGPDEPEPEA